MDFSKIYIKFSDNIPIEKGYKITRQEKKVYDLGFHDACEKINELLNDLPNEVKEQIREKIDH